MQEITKEEKILLTPESGFNLVGIDPFGPYGSRLYAIEHFDFYQDALKSKNQRKNPEEYLILYPGAD
ncbi:hypothetical protein [Candidatus Nitrosotenuis cloacae]|uniref:hypothetical protein n=1 Tax=Candidatus Nitrosotenuis cloacae TaxID=1603555 RepID=UPI00228236BF|nr:hypothetical protein [Candidatus Nitrosotenuis cloacae]